MLIEISEVDIVQQHAQTLLLPLVTRTLFSYLPSLGSNFIIAYDVSMSDAGET